MSARIRGHAAPVDGLVQLALQLEAGDALGRGVPRQQVRQRQMGGDPAGVEFDESKAVVAIEAGNYILQC